MVHSTTLLKLSRQGNVDVISALMNRALQPKGITVRVKLKEDCLKILLEGVRVPSQERLIPYVSRGLAKLGFDLTDEIYVYGRQVGSKTIAWTAAVTLPDAHYSEVPVSHSSTAASMDAPGAQSAETLTQPGLFSERFAEEILIDVIRAAIVDVFKPHRVNFDIELEGSDLLITLNTKAAQVDASLAKQIKQALAEVELDEIRLIRLYQRHPKTQQAMPIQEVMLKAPLCSSRFESPALLAEAMTDSTISISPVSSCSHPQHLKAWQGLGITWRAWGTGAIAVGIGLWWLLQQWQWVARFSLPWGLLGLMLGLLLLWQIITFAVALRQKKTHRP